MSSTKRFESWRPHPWHGLSTGPNPPSVVQAYIELTPFDAVKYEIDKETGYLRVDRPQRLSSQPPVLYGFIPRTFCADRVAALMPQAFRADGDPLDICVLSERPIAHAEVLVNARVVGGIPMLDGGEADDKIIAVLEKDYLWSDIEDIGDLPVAILERIRHYFATYKLMPGEPSTVALHETYGRSRAETVITAAMEDYLAEFS